ncbi:hypothetical protein H6A66_10185 [Bacteroides caecigallinarum]|uniref:TerY-C metal binding domain-containing protein n=1 Tax=Bacteroides caecigallinarum TaxID=1411144 RepID=UPI00195DEDC6|nr:TerY-C metal binding domain-containing protein [Bacteroides caecigallinarum]MBM6865530.1 hypothetical protein [Bacteroides caecigallinarum]
MKRLKREEMVIMATCQKTKRTFGITAQKEGNDYIFKWAFKLNAGTAKREGFEKNKVSGNIINSNEFPGCPHCGAQSWFQCGKCGRFVCMESDQKIVRCPECGNEGEIVYSDKFDLSGGEL